MLNDYNSKVTLELGELVANGVDIWKFDHKPLYPEEADQKELEQKFLDRYRFRQIGQETVGRFLHFFRTKYNELVPYYLDLYESVRLMHSVEDPFKAYDLTETYTQTTKNTGNATTTVDDESNTTTNGSTFTANSDTPQNYTRGSLSNHISEIGEGEQTSSSKLTNDGTTTTVNDNNGEMEYTLKREGNIGVQPLGQEINAYRSALINVDEQFLDEFNNLFLLTY